MMKRKAGPTSFYHIQAIASKTSHCIVFALIATCLCAATARAAGIKGNAASSTSKVKLVPHDKSIDVEIDGKIFTTYHFADDFILPAVRPFFYPALAADGTEMTIDHAQHPPLHAYQRSIWIGAGNVNGADHWKFKAKPLPKQRHIKFDYVHGDGFQEELIWEDAKGGPMLNEVRTVQFVAYPDGARQINFDLRFMPIDKNVTFFNTADNGLLSVRPNPEIAGNPEFTAADGAKECNHHTTWCDESGKINGKTYGIAIFDDPHNPRNPPLWHAGKDARLATDIFIPRPDYKRGDPDQHAGDFTIKLGQTVSFRYGMLFHAGDADAARLKQRYAEFIAGDARK
jgi:hypothetical protein